VVLEYILELGNLSAPTLVLSKWFWLLWIFAFPYKFRINLSIFAKKTKNLLDYR